MRAPLIFLFASVCALAHVGTSDVYLDGAAGPYQLFITVRPPLVIPGVADIQIRTPSTGIKEIHITPMPLTGEGSNNPPTPDVMVRSKQDAQFFTGNLWIMATGSWLVRAEVDGDQGKGVFSIPVPAVATRVSTMDTAFGAGLFAMMLVLMVGIVSIVGAGVRESQLEPGATPPPANRSKARIVMAATAVLVVGMVYLGNSWWKAEAKTYSNNIYKPLDAAAQVDGNKLTIKLTNNVVATKRRFDDFMAERKVNDFVPDHGHLMHLYVIRWPDMDRVWHLHPDMSADGVFEQNLPAIPAGDYKLFGDVVHSSGFPETIVSELHTSGIAGLPLMGDDAAGVGAPVAQGPPDTTTSALADGWKMVWDRDATPSKINVAQDFKFHLEDASGKRATDLEMYMGMPGHAAFVKTDGSVFAHVHPSGSVSMPALALANPNADPHAGMAMGAISEVGFPWGFPQPGEYRIIVQLKRAGKVETGIFNTKVN
jgi:hypothetical protein